MLKVYEVTFDLETTGTDIIYSAPVQVAMTVHYEGRRINSRKRLIHPGDEYLPIPEGAVKIHGITDIEVREKGIPADQFCLEWNSFIRTHQPAVLIGYNICNFDFPLLQNFLLKKHPQKFPHPPIIGLIDVMHMSSQFLGTKKWPKLKDMADKLEIPYNPDLLHDAMEDVNVTWQVYKKLREATKTSNGSNIER